MDVGGGVGEEHVAAPRDRHQRHALAGELLLEVLADAARALGLEADVALVGDHRALPGEALARQLDLEHLRVLQPQAGWLYSVSWFSGAKRLLRTATAWHG